jgi:hypothetical protein
VLCEIHAWHAVKQAGGRRIILKHRQGTMKIRLAAALLTLAISFAAPTFGQQKDTADPQTAQQIRALRIKFDEAFNRNDAAAVAALYAEDTPERQKSVLQLDLTPHRAHNHYGPCSENTKEGNVTLF